MTHYIGIDISKRDFHVCFNESETTGIFNNDLSGIRLFIRHLKKKGILPENSLLGLESTGSYHLPVAHLCTQAGYTVHVINPLITRRQRKATVRQVKTDPHDAILIRYCLMNGAGYPFSGNIAVTRAQNPGTPSLSFLHVASAYQVEARGGE